MDVIYWIHIYVMYLINCICHLLKGLKVSEDKTYMLYVWHAHLSKELLITVKCSDSLLMSMFSMNNIVMCKIFTRTDFPVFWRFIYGLQITFVWSKSLSDLQCSKSIFIHYVII